MVKLFAFCTLIFCFFPSCLVDSEKKTIKIHLEHFVQGVNAPIFKTHFLKEQGNVPVTNPNITYLLSLDSGATLPVVAKGGDYNLDNNPFRVILVDMNNDGIFNELEVDCVSVGVFGQDTVSLMGHLTPLTEEGLIIQAGDEKFSFSAISDNGESLNLEKLEGEDNSETAMVFPSKLLSLEAKLLNEQAVDISSLTKDKFVFFEFWYSGCQGCIASIPKINGLAEKYSKDLLIIGVNSYDDLAYAQKLTEKHDFLGFNQQILGVESPAIMDYFGSMSIHPRGYLFDREGTLVHGNISPLGLEKTLAAAIEGKK